MVEPVNLARAWSLNTRAWEKRTKLDKAVQHDRVNPHARGIRVYHVVVKRKLNRCTCFEEEERNVLSRGPNRKNPSPSPTVSRGP
ncbi:hypothetical protein GOBAR_AA30091 [Gossypium barbadense]|uniref:Uncharacterized protein n=1 Tax=Gossypium barbadense TaxID=3634 RepID=A0A2P5WHM4_GOSBA|nr:hypothetical protein GOBAR_AA30091 [Gossypium barbadense]